MVIYLGYIVHNSLRTQITSENILSRVTKIFASTTVGSLLFMIRYSGNADYRLWRITINSDQAHCKQFIIYQWWINLYMYILFVHFNTFIMLQWYRCSSKMVSTAIACGPRIVKGEELLKAWMSVVNKFLWMCFQHGSDVDLTNDENTLGFHLDLYSRYAESVKVRDTFLVCWLRLSLQKVNDLLK